jgi:hypothetical protein
MTTLTAPTSQLPTTPSSASAASADPNVFHVLVTVSVSGKMLCTPSTLNVTGSNVLISFELQSADWVFPSSDAVVVSNGGTQFPLPSWTVNDKQAALLDQDSAPGSFSYTVNVQHVATGRKLSLDPSIQNQP